MKDIWDTKVFLKVRIFVWKMFHDKLQTREQIFFKKKRLWGGLTSVEDYIYKWMDGLKNRNNK
jgi:hypothetical protein